KTDERKEILKKEIKRGLIKKQDESIMREIISRLEDYTAKLAEEGITENKKGFALIKKNFDNSVDEFEKDTQSTKQKLDNMFNFVEDVFGRDKEMLIAVTELTANVNSAEFIGKYGSEKYFENNEAMLFYQRQAEVFKQIEALGKMM
ncbi:MAG: hypothetical protein LKJ13_01210, partial [Clostridia bacterium]|nr:hypothetical protein [Clostridia bacterium]